MSPLAWIIISGVIMAVISLEGGLFSLFGFGDDNGLKRLMPPLVALAAGTMIGGALLHMLPEGLEAYGNSLSFFIWVTVGFSIFFALEQLIHWHHCNRASAVCKDSRGYLVIAGDCLHHLLAGLAVGGAFVVDIRLGITIWLLAVAHEIPKELGDFAVLVHSGWARKQALFYNFLSALPFLAGGLLAFFGSRSLNVTFLIPLAAGQFIYIGASDLVPEINHHEKLGVNIINFFLFVLGISLMALIAAAHRH